jgi:hypothetical protein
MQRFAEFANERPRNPLHSTFVPRFLMPELAKDSSPNGVDCDDRDAYD